MPQVTERREDQVVFGEPGLARYDGEEERYEGLYEEHVGDGGGHYDIVRRDGGERGWGWELASVEGGGVHEG